MQKHEYQSDFARKYLAEGKGEAAGRFNEARSALMRVLARRGFEVPPEARETIDSEQSVGRLERWLEVAVTASALSDVFSDA